VDVRELYFTVAADAVIEMNEMYDMHYCSYCHCFEIELN